MRARSGSRFRKARQTPTHTEAVLVTMLPEAEYRRGSRPRRAVRYGRCPERAAGRVPKALGNHRSRAILD